MNASPMPSVTFETTIVATEPLPSTAIPLTTLVSASPTPVTRTPTNEKSLTKPIKGASASAAKGLGKFETAVGGRTQIAARIAANSLSLEQEAFVALLLDPGRSGDSVVTLAIDAGITPEDVLKLYQKGAIAEANAIATAQIADSLPTVTREVLANAIETRQVCVCLKAGIAHPKCRRCHGTGLWVKDASAEQQKMVWENAGLLKKSGGININQNTAVGVVSGGGFMDRFVRSTDATAYDVKPSDIQDGEVSDG